MGPVGDIEGSGSWNQQIQNEGMWTNFEGSLFVNANNIVDENTNEVDVDDFYLDMDVFYRLCVCVTTLGIDD